MCIQNGGGKFCDWTHSNIPTTVSVLFNYIIDGNLQPLMGFIIMAVVQLNLLFAV